MQQSKLKASKNSKKIVIVKLREFKTEITFFEIEANSNERGGVI